MDSRDVHFQPGRFGQSWSNGAAPDSGIAVYLRFVRRDARYGMYSNVGSMQFVRMTGNFVIIEDEKLGYVIPAAMTIHSDRSGTIDVLWP